MNRGIQWKSGINNKLLAYILISEIVAKYNANTDTDCLCLALNPSADDSLIKSLDDNAVVLLLF